MKYCVYIRVSTKEQGKSGLGLEAQRATIYSYLRDADVLGEFVDVQSGSEDNRPQLLKAIEIVKTNDATLVVAKLDRLGRDAAFLQKIRKEIKILNIESPNDGSLLFAVRAGMAEDERMKISERTSAALQAKIARGESMNNNPMGKGLNKAMARSIEVKRDNANENLNNRRSLFALDLLMHLLQEVGKQPSWVWIAEQLNENGFFTSTGVAFTRGTAFGLWQRRHSFSFYKKIRPEKF